MTPAADGSRQPGAGDTPPGRVVAEADGDTPRELLGRLGFAAGASRPVVVVAGGADALVEPQLTAARAALEALRAAVTATGAAVVDGGTAAGVMALVGAVRADDPASMPVLVGVAPA